MFEPWDYINKSVLLPSFIGIVIHHSATPDGKTNDWKAIKLWHTGKIGSTDSKSRDYNPYILDPMRDIGYHLGIEKIDGRYEYQIGRSLGIEGGHTKGYNHLYIGICCVGNFDIEEPSEELIFKLSSICRAVMHKKPSIQVQNILPHWGFTNKSCPGEKFNIIHLRRAVGM